MLETYRELLHDHFDVDALRELLRRLRDGEPALVAVDRGSALAVRRRRSASSTSPQYLYEDDTPAAERRVQALTLDRDLLRELLGSDGLRELLDADAVSRSSATSARRRGRPRMRCTTCCAGSAI